MTDNKDDAFDDEIHEIDAKINGIFWYSDKISLSNVCITLILEYEQKINEINEEDAKDELYRILKGVSNRAASRYLMRPVIGFIYFHQDTSEKVIQLVNKWSADQDWHKGEFIIYPYLDNDDSGKYPSPSELLNYKLEPLEDSVKITDINHFLNDNKVFFEKNTNTDEKRKVLEFLEKDCSGDNEKVEEIKKNFQRFILNVKKEISGLAGDK